MIHQMDDNQLKTELPEKSIPHLIVALETHFGLCNAANEFVKIIGTTPKLVNII